MKQKILLITFLFNSLFIHAQLNTDKLFLDSMLNTSSGKFIKTSDNGAAFCGSQIGNQIGGLPQTGHIIKLDDAYNFQWAKSYSKGISSSTFFLEDFVQLTDHGYLALCRITDSISPTTYTVNMAIIRTDSAGGLLYVKTISDSAAPLVNEPVCLTAITDTTFYIGSKAAGSYGNIGICKIDINGSIIKSQYFRIEAGSHTATIQSLIKLYNGQFLITGSDNAGWANARRMNLFCLDDDLNILWNKSYYSQAKYLLTYKVLQDTDSSIWVFGQVQTGSTNPTPLIIKLSQTGNLIWANKYIPSLNFPMDFRTAVKWDNTFLAAGTNGYMLSYIPYILKIDTNGTILNSQTFTHNNQPYHILDLAKQNDSLIMFISSRLPAASTYGKGIAIMDSTLSLPCSNDDMNFTVASDSLTLDSLSYLESVTMISNDITPQFQASSFSLFETPLCSPNSIEESINISEEISLYPNPANSKVTISHHDVIKSGSIKIFNVFGEIIFTESILNEAKKEINLKDIADGIYLVNVFDGTNYYCKKLIVENN